jgi:hypothetical protein
MFMLLVALAASSLLEGRVGMTVARSQRME